MESFIHVRAYEGSSNASKETPDPKEQRRTESKKFRNKDVYLAVPKGEAVT
jgi:hypothetical protein